MRFPLSSLVVIHRDTSRRLASSYEMLSLEALPVCTKTDRLRSEANKFGRDFRSQTEEKLPIELL